jgi:hypothetical protein
MPKTVSWDDKENIRFINRVGHQKKVPRHRKMTKSSKEVYEARIDSLKTKIADKDQKIAEVVAEKDQKIAEKDQKIAEVVAEKDKKIAELEEQNFKLQLQLSSRSRKSSESSDSMNTSTSSTNSAAMSEASASSADTSMADAAMSS